MVAAAQQGLSVSGYPLDDAWIHLDYARALSATLTFGYAPGEWENGSTAPLWSMLLAVGLATGVSALVVGKLLGLLALCALAVFVFRVVRRVSSMPLAALAAAVVTLDPWLSVLSVSGMETVAAVAVAFAAIDALYRQRPWLTGVLLAAAGLLRPELGLMVPLALLALRPEQRTGSMIRPILLPPLLVGLGWFAYGIVVTGFLLPNTFWVKTAGSIELPAQLAALRALFLPQPWYLAVPQAAFMLVGMLALARHSLLSALLLLALPVALLVFYFSAVDLGSATSAMTPGSSRSFYFARYGLMATPWVLLWTLIGMHRSWRVLGGLAGGVARAGYAVLALLVLTVTWGWQAQRAEVTALYRASAAEIEHTQVKIARLVDARLPADAVIGTSDAGAIRFFTRQRVIDLMGLNSSPMLTEPDAVGWLAEQGLSHLVIWKGWHPRLLGDARLRTREIATVRVRRPVQAPTPVMQILEVRFVGGELETDSK